MKNKLILVLLLFTIQSFGQQLTIKEAVSDYFKEIKAATTNNKNLWDFDLYAPVLFVQPISRELYANYRIRQER